MERRALVFVYVSVKSMPFFAAARLNTVPISLVSPELALLAATPVLLNDWLYTSVPLLAFLTDSSALLVPVTILLIVVL